MSEQTPLLRESELGEENVTLISSDPGRRQLGRGASGVGVGAERRPIFGRSVNGGRTTRSEGSGGTGKAGRDQLTFSGMLRQREDRWWSSKAYDRGMVDPSMGWVLGRSVTRDVPESLDYDQVENRIHDEHVQERQGRSRIMHHVERTLLEAGVGVVTAMLGMVIILASRGLSKVKFNTVNAYLLPNAEDSAHIWTGFSVMLAFNATFALLSALFVVFVDPYTRGSGVPEMKSFLNGVRIPAIFGVRAFLSKFFGVIFTVPSGLVTGKEGPLIHLGAIVGESVCRITADLPGIRHFNCGDRADRCTKHMLEYHSDIAARDFVSVGGACGVAAAFGAPIGGVLQVEEMHSFWTNTYTWRSFFATMTTTLVLFSLLTVIRGSPGALSHDSLVAFGSFEGATRKADYPIQPGYNFSELLFFVMLGIVGGLTGALFNFLNSRLASLRLHYIVSTVPRLLEVLVVAFVTTLLVFGLSAATTCVEEPNCPANVTQADCCDQASLPRVRFACPAGQYNPTATLLYSPLDLTVAHLLHSCQPMQYTVLVVVFLFFFAVSAITYGINVPSGVFVPCMLTGAALGRIAGEVAKAQFGEQTDAGTFALIGAAAVLGGVTRNTIANAVIVIEVTGDLTYSVPIMAAVFAARFTGDFFNSPLFDYYITLLNIAYLSAHKNFLSVLRASDIMQQDVYTMHEVESVQKIAELLCETTCNGFPVIRKGKGTFQGMIRRDQLIILLRSRCFQRSSKRLVRADEVSPFGLDAVASLVTVTSCDMEENPRVLKWEDFRRDYPSIPQLEDVTLYQADLDEMYVDLTPYMHTSALTVHHTTHATRIHRLFRAMGLRHLTIVNSKNQVVGIITRKHLTKPRKKFGTRPAIDPLLDILNNDI
mmetsp:Transcript_15695/g.44525  ORF Transcript_15695/g.44525 Transcript_15695/m.44525 type:complete len:879 (+) Transcript_15695:66-2702(+)